MKKKFLFLLPILLLGVGLAACNEQQQPTEPNIPNPGETENPNGNVNQPETPTKPTYTVKITLPNGTAATGARAQWCSGTECKTPVVVNSLGVASNKMDDVEGGYFVHVAEGSLPKGYTYNPNIYTTDATNRNIEIKLLRIETPKAGEGTKEAPYQVGVGAYVVKVDVATEYPYYVFTATPGTYEIESLAVDKLATTVIAPLFIGYDTNLTGSEPSYVFSGGVGKNFKTTITVTEDQPTHYFGISFNSSKNAMGKDVPAEYTFTITKKSN